jgi:AcrR family transcriptional regulator
MADGNGTVERPSLRGEQRSVAHSRILDGAMVVFAEKGLSGTVDDVAGAANVSRRTVFRHFLSHAELFAAAVDRICALYEERLPAPPGPDQELDEWLLATAEEFHAMNRRLLGRGFWDIHVETLGVERDEPLSGRVWSHFARLTERVATRAWSAKGGRNRPPRWVVDAFAIMLSGFGTTAMRSYETNQAARVSAKVLDAVMIEGIREQRA